MRYDPRLSGLRGLAALGVVADHAGLLSGIPTALLGDLGIGVFLMLSVVLLVRGLDSNSNLKRYFRRRITRIWPLYFGTCAVVFLLFDRNPTHLAVNLAFGGIWVPSQQFTFTSWAPHFVLWTLQIEEVAYLVFPLVAKLGVVGRNRLGLLLVGLGGGCAGASIPVWSGGYACGLAAWTIPYGIGLLILGGGLSRGIPFASALLPGAVVMGPPVGTVMALLPAANILIRPPSLLGSRPAAAVGEISYGLYLTHAILLAVLGLALGIALCLPVAFLCEASVRPRTLFDRLRPMNQLRNPLVSTAQ